MTRVGLEPTTSRFDLLNVATAQPELRESPGHFIDTNCWTTIHQMQRRTYPGSLTLHWTRKRATSFSHQEEFRMLLDFLDIYYLWRSRIWEINRDKALKRFVSIYFPNPASSQVYPYNPIQWWDYDDLSVARKSSPFSRSCVVLKSPDRSVSAFGK